MILMATVGAATPSPAISQQFAAAQQTFANSAIGGSSNAATLYHPSYSMPANWTSPSSSGWTKIDVQLGTPPPDCSAAEGCDGDQCGAAHTGKCSGMAQRGYQYD
jgi:hypothetical protein